MISFTLLSLMLAAKFAWTLDIPYVAYGFFDQTGNNRKIKVQVIGRVVEVKSNHSRMLISLFEPNLAKKGEQLYILNHSGLIIGQLRVANISNTMYFGQIVSGKGYFRLIPSDSLVARRLEGSKQDFRALPQILGKAENYALLGDYGESIRYYKKALSIDKQNPKALMGLAICYNDQGLTESGLPLLQEAYLYRYNLISNEDKIALYVHLANYSLRQADKLMVNSPEKGQQKKEHLLQAQKFLLEALELSPDAYDLNYYLARVHFAANEDSQALLRLRKSIKNGGGFLFESYYLMGRIFFDRGLKEKAAEYYQKAATIQPGNQAIQRELARLRG